MHANLVAFDKQWNMALSDILEVWKRKGLRKRKVPPGLGKRPEDTLNISGFKLVINEDHFVRRYTGRQRYGGIYLLGPRGN